MKANIESEKIKETDEDKKGGKRAWHGEKIKDNTKGKRRKKETMGNVRKGDKREEEWKIIWQRVKKQRAWY